jgi:hypothetical protein
MSNRQVFTTKKSAEALIQSKRTIVEALEANDETFDVKVSKSNTELLGVLPYLFSFGAYAFENFKDMVVDAPKITHYQLGSIDEPVPLSTLYKYTIGEYIEQKEHFHAELYRLMREKKTYFLPTKSGGHLLDEPISIAVVTDKGVTSDSKVFTNLVTKTEGGNYEHTPREKIKGVILRYYKPLFEGHFNDYKDGFIKQPQLLYAMARHYHSNIAETAAKDFTPIKIVQLFYYLATHCNYTGSKITIDVSNMLKHILPSALKDDTIRYDNIDPFLFAFTMLMVITNDHKEGFDFSIKGLNINQTDRNFARQKADGTDNEVERARLEIKHHLKANHNMLEIAVEYHQRTAKGCKVHIRRKQ